MQTLKTAKATHRVVGGDLRNVEQLAGRLDAEFIRPTDSLQGLPLPLTILELAFQNPSKFGPYRCRGCGAVSTSAVTASNPDEAFAYCLTCMGDIDLISDRVSGQGGGQ